MGLSQPFVTDEFRISLAETIAWCLAKPKPWNPQYTFRSPELAYQSLHHFNNKSDDFRTTLINDVVEMRCWLLRGENNKTPRPQPANSLHGGRLFGYNPDINCFHGLEAQECEDFLNVASVPPWDTWVAFFDRPINSLWEVCLVSWVPAELVDMLDAAISVCPEESIWWTDKFDGGLTDELERVGLGYQATACD